ncbi:AlpA family phage regulatory protein [Desulfovibrio sp. OttesenSCG-928-C14]|nr:AlpA family phage regulatory protein [Desulfovibrio sp. OttesenSCG-928-C14]
MNKVTPSSSFRFISKKEAYAMLGISRATFERMVAVGLFPKPFQVGKRAVRWRSDEVEAFIRSMPRLEDAYASHFNGKEVRHEPNSPC